MATHNSPRPPKSATTSRPRCPATASHKPRTRRITAADRRQALRLIADPVQYMDAEAFHEPGAKVSIFDEAPSIELPDTSWYQPLLHQAATESSARTTTSKVLTAAEERVLFLQFNFARFSMDQMRDEIGETRPTDRQVRSVLKWNEQSMGLREQLAESNLALVLAMAKRFRMGEMDFGDLISEGNMALLRSIDKFDIERGFKFSTYACRAILKSFSRASMKHSKYRQRFPAEFDPELERSNGPEERRRADQLERAAEAVEVIKNNSADLTDIEQEVLHHRFGMDAGAQGRKLTLAQVGGLIGLTKERVRQIQNRALAKLKQTLSDRYLSSAERELTEIMAITN